jgi:ParB-like chromosome segregation protein Spo0J
MPYERNARSHSDSQIAQIAASIGEFGFTNPIAVDPGGRIIAGYARYLAAGKRKLKQVPVIVLEHLSETQQRAYRIADNQLALNASWMKQCSSKSSRLSLTKLLRSICSASQNKS